MPSRVVAALAMTGAAFLSIPALAQLPSCGQGTETSSLIAQIRHRHLEKPGAIEPTSHSATVELARQEDGRWTLTLTHPNGRSCQVAAGDALGALQAEIAAKTY